MVKKLIIIGIAVALIAAAVGIGLGIYFKDRYTITYDLVGGTMDVEETSVKFGKKYELPFPSKNGAVFAGWYYEGEFIEAAGSAWPFEKDVTLTAKWVIKDEYSFTYETTDGGYIISDFKGVFNEYIILPLEYEKKPVVGIKDNVFSRLKALSPDIESQITMICVPAGASYNANKLGFDKKVTISEYNIVGEDDFLYYDNGEYLTAVCFRGSYKKDIFVYGEYNGKQIKALGSRLFYGAVNKIDQASFTSFSRVMLHENIVNIGAEAFKNCGGLKVSLFSLKEDGGFNEITDLPVLFDWSQRTTIEEGNEQLLDVITQIRPAMGWSVYSYASFYVKLNANGGTVENNSLSFKRNAKYTLPTPVREGYTFDGWYLGDTLVAQEGEKWGYAKHIELTAKWIENEKEG
ncbi:MAG: hypothetical protein E7596_03770 [Ruminococcaceae bacterium]|nr:hypothetical protein [Oscillospiraceae bacterium]